MRALNLISDNKVKEVLKELRSTRDKAACKMIDITNIVKAIANDNFDLVHKGSFYRLHGGEYCQVLEILNRL